jgi:hypothetical protein
MAMKMWTIGSIVMRLMTSLCELPRCLKLSEGSWLQEVRKLTGWWWCARCFQQAMLIKGMGIDVPVCIGNASWERVWGPFV